MANNPGDYYISSWETNSKRGRLDTTSKYQEFIKKTQEKMPQGLKNLNDEPLNKQIGDLLHVYTSKKEMCSTPQERANQQDPATIEINKMIESQAAAHTLAQIYTLYMGAGQDAKWRIGNVSEVITDCSLLYDKNSDKNFTDEHGFIFTPTSFYKTYTLPPALSTGTEFKETYMNFGFPPFQNNSGDTSPKTLQDYIDLTKDEEDRKVGGKNTYFDFETMRDFRGNFTYRTMCFKTLNDSINYLQWLFERVSGISCTFLTEWDLSVYMQENIIDKDPNKVNYIDLTHRLLEDSIYPGRTDISYSFGVVNCAASKMKNANRTEWTPYSYPLSTNWVAYPDWRLRASQQIPRKRDDGKEDAYPKFYEDAATKATEWTSPNESVRTRLIFDDYQGAALAGWEDLHTMGMYQSIYTTFQDGMSNADIRLNDAMAVFTKARDIIEANFEDNWGVPLFPVAPPKVSNDDVPADGSDETPKERSAKKRIIKLFLNKGNKTTAAEDRVNKGKGARTGKGEYDEETGETIVTNADTVLGTAPETADTANGTGICQRNPPLFGGPHSPVSSPLTTQSYMESNNVMLRNIPRVSIYSQKSAPGSNGNVGYFKDPTSILSVDGDDNKSAQGFPGLEKYYTQAGQLGDTDVRPYESSFLRGKNHLEEGFHESTNIRGTAQVRMYRYFPQEKVSDGYYDDNNHTWHSATYRWPDYDSAGRRIHYENRYSWWWWNDVYISLGNWYGWSNEYIWKNDPDVNKEIISVYYSYGEGQWKGKITQKGVNGYVIETVTKDFKRYFLHNELFTEWSIRKVKRNHIEGWETRHRIKRGGWGWLNRVFHITESYQVPILAPYETWQLFCPGGHQKTAPLPDWHDVHVQEKDGNGNWVNGPRMSFNSKEEEILSKMIDIHGGTNAEANLIFLQGASSEYDRRVNGPENIFRIKCKHCDYAYTIRYQVWIKSGCDGWWQNEYTSRSQEYISVDPTNTTFQACDCRKHNVFTNTDATSLENFLEVSTLMENTPKAENCKAIVKNFLDCVQPLPPISYYNSDDKMGTVAEGVKGYGILSYISGQNPDVKDDMFPAENYRKYICSGDSNWKNKTLDSFDFNTSTTSDRTVGEVNYKGRTYKLDNPGVTVTSSSKLSSVDPALRKALLTAFTTGTFYANSQFDYPTETKEMPNLMHFYRIHPAMPYRIFYFQLKYQLEYLKIVRDLFTSTYEKKDKDGDVIAKDKVISFKRIGNAIKNDIGTVGVIGLRTSNLADPTPGHEIIPLFDSEKFQREKILEKIKKGNPDGSAYKPSPEEEKIINPTEKINKVEVYGYNQWIKEARKLFEGVDGSDPDENQKEFINQLDIRIKAFENTIKFFEEFISNDGAITYQKMEDAQDQIYSLSHLEKEGGINGNNKLIERALLAYLNVLYEYRRFFINKRFNKQDGPMFLIRSIESVIPMLINNINNQESKGDGDGDGGKKKEYKVAFTAPEMDFATRVDLYKDNPPTTQELFEIERVKKVYIKVEYVTKEIYEEDRKLAENNPNYEPKVVKVRKWDWKRTPEGMISFDENSKPIKVFYGGYRYAIKPKNGIYRLENPNILNWHADLKKAKAKNDTEKIKSLEENKVDEAIWYIKWGLPESKITNESGRTDIVFDIKNFFDITLLNGILTPEKAANVACSSATGLDYWEVQLTCQYPRQKFYMPATGLRIKEYTGEEDINDSGSGGNEPLNPPDFYIGGKVPCPICEKTEYAVPDINQIAGGLLGENGLMHQQ